MGRSVMYAVDLGPTSDIESIEKQLESLRHRLGSRGPLVESLRHRPNSIRQLLEILKNRIAMRFTGYESYCQRCRKNSVWKEELPFRERRPAREDALGVAVSPRLLADAPFEVYGLKGNPMGLRLSDLDWSGGNTDRAILRYTAGDPGAPQRALDLTQSAGPAKEPPDERILTELKAVISLVMGCASPEQRERYRSRRNVHKDWNLDYLRRAQSRNVTIQIDGEPVSVELAQWQGPQQIVLARLNMDGRPVTAMSLGVSQVQLLGALKSLVALRRDADALSQHERDLRASQLG